ncbi:MAG: 50S ribosomal protein L17 [Myxococcales bacterium]|nr:50S ribosomal protein L17 [Myxococcales bacterium]
MRHLKAGRKFGRNPSHRRAMFRNLAANLVVHERIETTEAKAKELRRVVERLISKATRLGDDLSVDVGKLKDDQREQVVARRIHAQRTVSAFLPRKLTKTEAGGELVDVDPVHKLFHNIAPRYMDRVKAGNGGGYTRIMKLGPRRGDNAPMAIIELLGAPEPEAKKPRKSRKAAAETEEVAED